MTVTVEPVAGRRTFGDWLAVPRIVHADDPAWVSLPDIVERRRVSARHAPFFRFGEVALFVAYRGGRPVGRISAQVNLRHLDVHGDGTGHFGFFDCADDPAAAAALVQAAAAWLAGRGLTRMVGPLSLSLNEECGCLVEGFDSPPAILMPHHRPWTGRLLESTGLEKEIDLLAFRKRKWRAPDRVMRISGQSDRDGSVGMRRLDMRRYAEDMRLAFDIVTDAWQANWGFVPFHEAEVENAAYEMRPFMRPDFLQFLTLEGREVGLLLAMPNVNEVLGAMRPSPIGLIDLLRLYLAVRTRGTRTYRVLLMGIRREFQSSRIGSALMGALFRELLALEQRLDPEWVEMSWVVESNRPMMHMAEIMAGAPEKRYRIYAKPIAASAGS